MNGCGCWCFHCTNRNAGWHCHGPLCEDGKAEMKSPTVFFDCRGCGWSCGTNNDEFAVEFIAERIQDHLKHDARHLALPRRAGGGGVSG